VEPRRSWNHANIHDYLQALDTDILPVRDNEFLDPEQLMLETVFLSLRTVAGIDLHGFKKRYHREFKTCFRKALQVLEDGGLSHLVSLSSSRCALTGEGRTFADAVARIFAEHMDLSYR
jgi:oxygen-independent coproporphyrinogen-3 oxidase